MANVVTALLATVVTLTPITEGPKAEMLAEVEGFRYVEAQWSRYDPGVFEATVAAQLDNGAFTYAQWYQADYPVAVQDCRWIGDTLTVLADGNALTLLVVDCQERSRDAVEHGEFFRYLAGELHPEIYEMAGCAMMGPCAVDIVQPLGN